MAPFRRFAGVALAALSLAGALAGPGFAPGPGGALAQGASPPPVPADAAPSPMAPPPVAAPPATITQAPAPGGAAIPGAGATATPGVTAPLPGAPPAVVAGLPTLIAQPGDPSDVDEVVLPEKPVMILSGQSSWDNGYKTLREAFAKVGSEIRRTGSAPAGRPLVVFTDTADDTFRFDAMVPVDRLPTPSPALPAGFRFGVTPSGKAYRFVHKQPYDDIDTTYETVTTYLDAKDVVAKDAFIEEFANDAADAADPSLEVNIFVQPK